MGRRLGLGWGDLWRSRAGAAGFKQFARLAQFIADAHEQRKQFGIAIGNPGSLRS